MDKEVQEQLDAVAEFSAADYVMTKAEADALANKANRNRPKIQAKACPVVKRLRKTIIHVNQHHIKANAKPDGQNLPVLTVKDYKENRYGHTAVLLYNGEEVGRFVYSPDKPLSCGAKVWFETNKCEVRT